MVIASIWRMIEKGINNPEVNIEKKMMIKEIAEAIIAFLHKVPMKIETTIPIVPKIKEA